MALVLVIAWGCKATPDRVCDHVTEVSQVIAKNDCIDRLQELQTKAPAAYDLGSRCLLDSKNQPTVDACVEEMSLALCRARFETEGKPVLSKIMQALASVYADRKLICPSASPVPPAIQSAYQSSPMDWRYDEGWSCIPGFAVADVQHFQYGFRTEPSSGQVVAYARATCGLEFSQAATAKDGVLDVSRDVTEQTVAAAALAAQADESTALMSQLKAQEDRVAKAEFAVQNATSDVARAAAHKELAEAKTQVSATKQQLDNAQQRGFGGGGTAPARKPCNCPPRDPLCACIP